MERTSVFFQQPNLLIGKVCVAVVYFCVLHTLQSALESRQEARIVQIDFSEALIWSTIRNSV